MSNEERSWVVVGVLAGLGVIFGLGWLLMNLPRFIGFLGSGL